jgi:hypothetical protein
MRVPCRGRLKKLSTMTGCYASAPAALPGGGKYCPSSKASPGKKRGWTKAPPKGRTESWLPVSRGTITLWDDRKP